MKNDTNEKYFASCPKGMEELVRDELEEYGAKDLRMTAAGAGFRASKAVVYKTLMCTRFANRILWQIEQAKAETAQEIYSVVYQIAWEKYLSQGQTFIVDFVGTNQSINNSQFGAMKVKDAVVDRFKKLELERPNVDKRDPDLRIHVRLNKGQIVVSLDLSGDSLHKRGYRIAQGDAPLKENLAAAILVRTGWPRIVQEAIDNKQTTALLDPMCGSGTFLFEGALLAAHYPPGFLREDFSIQRLAGFDTEVWESVRAELKNNIIPFDHPHFPKFLGCDSDERALGIAKKNLESMPFKENIVFEKGDSAKFNKETSLPSIENGLLICNPPYGERLGEVEALRDDYRELGQMMKAQLPNWQAGVLTSNPDLAKEMRLRAKSKYKFFNGKIPAELNNFEILGGEKKLRKDHDLTSDPLSEGAQMVANRLQKNARKLAPWRKKKSVECYRLYDADMPEYSAAIDVYGDHYHIQEYQAPKTIDPKKSNARFWEIQQAVAQSFDVPIERIVCKTRKRQKGKTQYEKQEANSANRSFNVKEGAATLEVNLHDYLDTGLFLDHRPLRKKLYETSAGKSFLNLFCYTATASVQAILGRAASSISVDMSNTYLEWARRNYELNNIHSKSHQLQRGDCVQWLAKCRQGFDVIMLDPPSFSNSKSTDTVLDIQRDHVKLISRCVEILNPGGVLYFSTNLRSFALDESVSRLHKVEDITASTIDPDFERNKKIHYCWKISAK